MMQQHQQQQNGSTMGRTLESDVSGLQVTEKAPASEWHRGGESKRGTERTETQEQAPGSKQSTRQSIASSKKTSTLGASATGPPADLLLRIQSSKKRVDAAAPRDRYSIPAMEVPRGTFFAMEEPAGGASWHALLWHSATNGVDQCLLLHGALSMRCVGAKLCLRVTNGAQLTAFEVAQTVEQSAALVVLLTNGVLARPDTQA